MWSGLGERPEVSWSDVFSPSKILYIYIRYTQLSWDERQTWTANMKQLGWLQWCFIPNEGAPQEFDCMIHRHNWQVLKFTTSSVGAFSCSLKLYTFGGFKHGNGNSSTYRCFWHLNIFKCPLRGLHSPPCLTTRGYVLSEAPYRPSTITCPSWVASVRGRVANRSDSPTSYRLSVSLQQNPSNRLVIHQKYEAYPHQIQQLQS